MPPPPTELVLYQHDASYDKRDEPPLPNITWSPCPPQGNALVKGDVLGALLASWGPNLLSTPLLGHLRTRPQNSSGFTVAINVIRAQFILLRRRIETLEAQNDDLRHENMMYHSDVGALESELTNLRADYYSELFQRRQETRRVNEDKEEIKSLKAQVMMQRTEIMILKDRNAQADIFMQAMRDLNIHNPVLQTSCKSVMDGSNAEEALVKAVLKASACKDSAWSQIIPAVVGPRSPEHYLCALDLALKARRDLQERKKISGFWKLKAMADPSNAGTLTPSSSQISDICELLKEQQDTTISPDPQGCKTPDSVPEIIVDDDEFPSTETVTQMRDILVVSKEIEPVATLLRSIDSVDTQMTVTEDLDASHDSDSYSVANVETDEAYLSSGYESTMSTATMKPTHIAKSESIIHDTVLDIAEPTGCEEALSTAQNTQLDKEVVSDTPLDDEVSFSVGPSTSSKPSRSSKASSYLPVTPLRSIARTRTSISSQSPSSPTIMVKSRTFKENINNKSKVIPPAKSFANSPIRSRLSTPKHYVSKRPILQSINPNVPPTTRNVGESCDTSDDEDKVLSSHNNVHKSSAKNLRKRRGVILVEKPDVGKSANVKSEPEVASANVIRSNSPKPTVLTSTGDAIGIDGKDSIPQLAEENDFGGHLAQDASDVEQLQSPLFPAAANAEEFSPLSLLQSECVRFPSHCSSGEECCAAVPSPTSAIITRFVESFSDSDLGSLEMTDDDYLDSDCEDIRQVQQNITPIRPKRTIRYDDDGDDGCGQLSASISNTAVVSALASSDSNSGSISSPPRSRPVTPFSKSLSWLAKKKESSSLSASSSGSSCTASTASGSDGQTGKKKSKLPLFGLARRLARSSTSPLPINKSIDTSSGLPVYSNPDPLPNKNQPSPPPATLPPKPSFWNKRNSNDASKQIDPVTPTKTISPSKIPKSDSTQKRSPGSSLKPSAGQSFIRRLSNVPIPKSKPTPQPTAQPTPQTIPRSILQPIDSGSTYLAPPSPHYTKPRSHTINSISPLPPSLSTPTPQSLMAGSTKPRSHTVNTYSPTTRSPLSRLASDTSTTNNKSTPTKGSRIPPGSSLPRSVVSKPTISSPMNIAKNSTLPTRVNKSSAKNQSASTSQAQETKPKPPTAAFMRPAGSPASATRRMTNSITPLIPNWTPSASNGLTPKQCRSMFRNSLSMVVR